MSLYGGIYTGNRRSPYIISAGNFQATDISGLTIWADAQDRAVTLNGSDAPAANDEQVKTILDKSGNANNLTNATSNQQPKFLTGAVGGRPAWRFYWNSLFTFLSAADHASMNCTTMYAIGLFYRTVDFGTTETIFGKYSVTGNQREWRLAVNGANEKLFGPATADGITDTAFGGTDLINLNTLYLGEIWCDGTNHNIAINGGTPTQTAFTTLFNGTSPYFLGTRDGGGEPFGGYLFEHRFYNRTLNASERQATLQDMNKKWDLGLAF